MEICKTKLRHVLFAVVPPIAMDQLEKRGILRRLPWIGAPVQILLCGLCLTFATPMCCALFPQKSSMPVSNLEPELQVRVYVIYSI